MPGFTMGLRPEHSVRAYAEHRERLIAANFSATVLVIISVTLLYVFAVVAKGTDAFRAELAANALQLLVPVVALLLARGPLRSRVEHVALGLDLAYTALLAYRLFLPTANISGTALFLSLKMLSTAVLFPWRATFQQASVLLTLTLYVGAAWLAGAEPVVVHQWVGPIIAGATYPYLHHTGQFVTAAVISLVVGAWTLSLKQPAPHDATPEAAAEAALEPG